MLRVNFCNYHICESICWFRRNLLHILTLQEWNSGWISNYFCCFQIVRLQIKLLNVESWDWFQFEGCSLCKAASYRKRPLRDRVTDTLRPLSYESPTFIGRGAREGVGGRSLSSTIQGYQPCNSKTPKTTLKFFCLELHTVFKFKIFLSIRLYVKSSFRETRSFKTVIFANFGALNFVN